MSKMARQFPLYESLLKRIQKDAETPNWTRLCSIISNLDEKHSETIASIIYHHSILNQGGNEGIPYNGCSLNIGRGCTFTPETLPLILQLIIAQYIIMMS
jgi:hypothetical protein